MSLEGDVVVEAWQECRSVVDRLVQACVEQGHGAPFHADACEVALPALAAAQAHEMKAREFDAGQLAASCGHAIQGHEWPMAALMRVMRDAVLEQPDIQGLWRTTRITTGPARLAERGFPADAFMRTCMADALAARVSSAVQAVWLAVAHGELPRENVAYLEQWLRLMDGLPGLKDHENPQWDDVQVIGRSGGFREYVERWIEKTSITHLLGWRCDDVLDVCPTPEALYLGGSRSATPWVFERFTETYLDRWSDDSLHWEIAFSNSPAQVAAAVGLDQKFLIERVVLVDDIAREITQRVMNPRTASHFAGEPVLALLEAGDIGLGAGLARRLASAGPDDRVLEQLKWFSALVTCPTDARDAFVQLDDGRGDPVLAANIATCYLMEGNVAAVTDAATVVRENDRAAGSVWLWWSSSVPHEPRVKFTSLRAWLEELATTASQVVVVQPG